MITGCLLEFRCLSHCAGNPFDFSSLGIARVMGEIGGVGRATPAQHPHIFPYIPATPNDPLILALWDSPERRDRMSEKGGDYYGIILVKRQLWSACVSVDFNPTTPKKVVPGLKGKEVPSGLVSETISLSLRCHLTL